MGSQTVVVKPRMQKSTEWSFDLQNYKVGTPMQVEVAVPVTRDGEWTSGAEEMFEMTYGEPLTRLVEHGADVEVEVPARSKCIVEMSVKQSRVLVPFTAHVSNTFEDGIKMRPRERVCSMELQW